MRPLKYILNIPLTYIRTVYIQQKAVSGKLVMVNYKKKSIKMPSFINQDDIEDGIDRSERSVELIINIDHYNTVTLFFSF